jgi:hypothetical protein
MAGGWVYFMANRRNGILYVGVNAMASWPSFKSHLSNETSAPSSRSLVASANTHCWCEGELQLYEMKTLGWVGDVSAMALSVNQLSIWLPGREMPNFFHRN